jgi:transposase
LSTGRTGQNGVAWPTVAAASRISPHLYNTPDEIDRALRLLCASRRGDGRLRHRERRCRTIACEHGIGGPPHRLEHLAERGADHPTGPQPTR